MDQIELKIFKELQAFDIQITETVFGKQCQFVRLMLETNQTFNLTAIKDYQEALYKHLFDSLFILKLPFWKDVSSILDVGSGAGIPAIPLALVSPDKKFVSLEATQKKVVFQQQAIQELQLKNITAVWGRAEDLGRKTEYRECFDLVIARALAAVNVLAEYTLPFAKPASGLVCYYKGKDYETELTVGAHAIDKLGGKVATITTFDLPEAFGTRHLITIEKHRATPPEFPRRTGIPFKSPLK